MMLQDWSALETWERVGVILDDGGLGYRLGDRRAEGDRCVRFYLCMPELSDPSGRPKLHSCCG